MTSMDGCTQCGMDPVPHGQRHTALHCQLYQAGNLQPEGYLASYGYQHVPSLVDEVSNLARWKAEAMQVLAEWDTVLELVEAVEAVRPPLGSSRIENVRQFVEQAVVHFTSHCAQPSSVLHARPTDPSTAQAAGDRVSRTEVQDVRRFSATSRQGRLLDLYGKVYRTSVVGYTDQEAAERVARAMHGGDEPTTSVVEGTRRRCSDLRAAGYLVDSGESRKNPGSPDESAVWALSPLGYAALQRMDDTGWSA